MSTLAADFPIIAQLVLNDRRERELAAIRERNACISYSAEDEPNGMDVEEAIDDGMDADRLVLIEEASEEYESMDISKLQTTRQVLIIRCRF